VARLEDLTKGAAVSGVRRDQAVTVVDVQWHGSNAVTLTYRDAAGKVDHELLYRDREPTLDVVEQGRPWSFDGDGALFRLVSEAHRIRLAHLFDPVLAVHTSMVDPLPHQITAVYEAMLPRQPLRFLLADDPGAGKTIMAGLLIKELIARGDLHRCMVVCPGSLAEQWQDELYRRFQLPFEILTNDKLESARTGNWFLENDLIICRLDKLSRNEDIQLKLKAPDCRWDLVVCDEAHKMSATFFGGEIKYTKRYRLGQLLSTLTRHFLLMTATPHNGKEEDFQLFMALLDGDRFEGRFRDGVHTADVSDLMRRMVKEKLLKFDATPLFPERIAYTVPYKLSDAEARLYKDVTEYVREEFNRADALQNDKRAGTVGFALTILQRRLASSPEAIYQSLRRRRERLERRQRELELLQRGAVASAIAAEVPVLDAEDVEDLDEAPDNEVEAAEEQILDQATAARTIDELKAEIATLQGLESLALTVRRSGQDCKWRELSTLLASVFTRAGLAGSVAEKEPPYGAGDIPRPTPSPHQKLIIFTEHRDTLAYLHERIATVLGRREAVLVIHGGMGREERTKAQEAFKHDPEVQVLVATDAAGEGINLQRAHLMVNYDLPWNPNRIEQRFGRIHRIGQTEVCHLWNLVAEETREGDVYRTLLEKLEEARKALGGQVFDVLGKLQFDGKPLRELLIDAVRYGEQPEVRERLNQVIAHAFDRNEIADLLEEHALAHDAMDASCVRHVREEMERAEARRSAPSAAALHRVVLPGGVQAAGWHGPPVRAAPLCDHPRAGNGPEPRPTDRWQRAGAPALRAHRLREGAADAAGPAAGGVRVPRPPAARCDDRPHHRARPRSAAPRHGSGRRTRSRRGAASALLPRTHDPGRQHDAERRAPGDLTADALRRGRRGREHAPPALRAVPRLPATHRGRAEHREHPRSFGVCVDHPRPGAAGAGLRHRARRPRAPAGGAHAAPGADREDARGREGPVDQGDQLLGPPGRGSEAAGAGRQAERAAELAGGPPPGRRPADAAAEATGAARPRRADVGVAAGRARWARRGSRRTAGSHDRQAGRGCRTGGRRTSLGRAGTRRRDGG
jgi:SNF2 family DNA or RNA helicase